MPSHKILTKVSQFKYPVVAAILLLLNFGGPIFASSSALKTVADFVAPFQIPQTAQALTMNHDFPRLANYYLKWGMTRQEAIDLAKWNVVIVDMEAQTYTPENLKLMRQLNPNIVILAYITSQEIRSDAGSLDPQTLRYKLAHSIPDSWYLKNNSGQKVNWWPGTYMLNVANTAPAAPSPTTPDFQRWNDFLPYFVSTNILSTGLWDGVFYDNMWGGASWLNFPIDFNGDGTAESAKDQDSQWQDGMRTILSKTHQMIGPTKLIIANDGVAYYQVINGSLFETFPSRGWQQTINNYSLVQNKALPPTMGIINSNTNNTGKQDFREVRFGLTSALLSDGYFSYDYGDKDHSQLWWFDEYSNFLGRPKTGAISVLPQAAASGGGFADGLWRRDFEKGIVFLNSTDKTQVVDLDGEYEKLHGTQDPVTNNGTITDSVTIPPKDAIMLLRPLDKIEGAVFSNGSFARVFDAKGNVKRNGFFSYLNQFRGGTNIYVGYLSGQQLRIVQTTQGHVLIFDSELHQLQDIMPYGSKYTGGINLAVGDLDNNGTQEIITMPDKGGAQIKIYNYDGSVSTYSGFFAYDKKFTGGATVAAADVDGDGKVEIITGPGPSSGTGANANNMPPLVRVFDASGNLKKDFLAYDKNFKGGVSLAAGDYNGDSVPEVLTGQLTSGVQVRVFTNTNAGFRQLGSGFDAFKSNKTQGVRVIALDLDGDRSTEILATSTKTFTVSTIK
ncbi:hypothetical protein HY224_03250 [Candidatus Uhrbacteria bacterium]|nr:hypothetical protein [Candidatus Uhrbacteria bacterium]